MRCSDACLDAIDALAGRATQLWLVEDMHWAAGDVLAFIDLAATRRAPHGRLIIETARPSLIDRAARLGHRRDWQATRRACFSKRCRHA